MRFACEGGIVIKLGCSLGNVKVVALVDVDEPTTYGLKISITTTTSSAHSYVLLAPLPDK